MARRVPSFDAFAARAKEIAASIPAEFTADVEDVVVHRDVLRHPQLEDVVTLGECEASPLAALTGAGPVRSIVHLYYGSFVDLARRDETFDVDAELRETIEHEVKHHLEDKAGLRGLEDEDDLFDAHARFREGLDVPRGWYRAGERLEPNVWEVEGDLFVELRLRRKEFEAQLGKRLSLTVLGEPFEAEIPADAEAGETLTYEGEGLLDDPEAAEGAARAGDEVPASGEAEGRRGGDGGDAPAAGDLHLVLDVR